MGLSFLYVPFKHKGDESTPRAKLDQPFMTFGDFHLHGVDVFAPTRYPLNVQGFKVGHALALAPVLHFAHQRVLLTTDDIAVHQFRVNQKGTGGFPHHLSEGHVQIDKAPLESQT